MRTYNFVFTEQEIGYILNVLSKQPYIEVANLIANIQNQGAAATESNHHVPSNTPAEATE